MMSSSLTTFTCFDKRQTKYVRCKKQMGQQARIMSHAEGVAQKFNIIFEAPHTTCKDK